MTDPQRSARPTRRWRIGAVSYLNTKPLVYGLERRIPEATLQFDVPSRLADRLADGSLDVALIPSVEFFQDPGYRIVSDACIGCRGPVLSVKLLTRKPWPAIRSVGLDEGSRTSAALSRILLKKRFGLEPELRDFPLGQPLAECEADAILLIGDRAIHPPTGDFVDSWDLGQEWCQWSGLPFVFAMWTARREADLGTLPDILSAARDEGLKHLEQIAEAEARTVDLSHDVCLSYLRDNLYFYLGARERAGLTRFYDESVHLGLAPPELDIPRACETSRSQELPRSRICATEDHAL